MHATKLAALALFMPVLAHGADWGLGTTLNDTGGTVYVPIEIDETMRLEPFGSYFRNEFGTPGGTSGFSGLELGIGVFKSTALEERVRVYAGGRLSFLYAENEVAGGPDETAKGLAVSPVLGGEVFPLPQLSFSVEVFATLSQQDASIENDTTDYGTGSRFVARFFFK